MIHAQTAANETKIFAVWLTNCLARASCFRSTSCQSQPNNRTTLMHNQKAIDWAQKNEEEGNERDERKMWHGCMKTIWDLIQLLLLRPREVQWNMFLFCFHILFLLCRQSERIKLWSSRARKPFLLVNWFYNKFYYSPICWADERRSPWEAEPVTRSFCCKKWTFITVQNIVNRNLISIRNHLSSIFKLKWLERRCSEKNLS